VVASAADGGADGCVEGDTVGACVGKKLCGLPASLPLHVQSNLMVDKKSSWSGAYAEQVSCKLQAEQDKQVEVPGYEYSPFAHGEQTEAPATETLPAEHIIGKAAPSVQ